MKEFVQLAGVRRWHGDEFVAIQKETLDGLQGFFSQFGNIIISGCKITWVGATFSISDGYVGINHADGYKIVKVTAQGLGSALNFPYYITIAKTTQTKLYDDAIVKASSYTYTGAISNVVPGVADYITLYTEGGLTWKESLSSTEPWRKLGTAGNPAAPVFTWYDAALSEFYFRKNKLTNTVELRAKMIFKAGASIGDPPIEELLFTLPFGYKPAFKVAVAVPIMVDGVHYEQNLYGDNVKHINLAVGTTGKVVVNAENLPSNNGFEAILYFQFSLT